MRRKHKFEPDLELEHNERGALALMAASEGYRIMHRIARSEVDKFIVNTLNANLEEPAKAIERLRIAKVAAQLYEGFTAHINREIAQYTETRNSAARQEPVDPTEGMLDLGPRASRDLLEIASSKEGIV